MRTFSCSVCGSLLIFENSVCVTCGTPQGFFLPQLDVLAVPRDGSLVPCANLTVAGCSWLVTEPGGLCLSCRLTRTRPADDDLAGMASYARTEAEKRRLIYQLVDLNLPVVAADDDPHGLAFDLLSSAREKVITGHADGVVTIDLAEGEDPHREAMRVQMGEAYRTMLGHLRHETGHYYQQVLVDGMSPQSGWSSTVSGHRPWVAQAASSERYVELFGDPSADYGEALARHYEQGAPPDWRTSFVSEYATAHPFEDWAETFAHYLHITDTLQSAAAYGVSVEGPGLPVARAGVLEAEPVDEVASLGNGQEIVDRWLPISYALNAMSRSMGNDDLYPFVLSRPVIEKLCFVHDLIAGT
ncbi:zinc-binding metallopeptidase family protein [Nocardioides sp.]|uniref:zinc-binding metallopeptidase family protein n=1 Tax=Nocardioides sp. TaxID=35761 RepID=UPI003D14A7CE